MLKFSGFHFVKLTVLCIAILGLALITVGASAQTETEKMEDNGLKINDRVLLEENSSLQDNHSSTVLTVRQSTTAVVKATPAPVRRDLPAGSISEKEVKKNESPSTLSFNIFLYIVDRFKAD